MNQAADAILQAAQEASLDELSDVEVDGDGSSSLSEIEYRDIHQDEEAEASDDRSNESEEENDSEAETERLEPSPNVRTHKDVVLSSGNDGQIYERSPSKLNNQILADEQGDEEDEDPLSDDDISLHESHKSSVHKDAAEPTTVATSLEDSSGEGKRTQPAIDADNRKRKRSIMAGSGLDDGVEEPLRKRTGSVMAAGNDYAVEDEEQPDEEEGDTSNPISGNISGEEGGEQEDEVPDEVEEPTVAEEEVPEAPEITVSPKKRGRKKKKPVTNGVNGHDEEQEAPLEGTAALNGEDDNAENEGDEAEVVLKNEEERKLLYCLP